MVEQACQRIFNMIDYLQVCIFKTNLRILYNHDTT